MTKAIGVINPSLDNHRPQFENWIDLHNGKELHVRDIAVRLTNLYNQELDLHNPSTIWVKLKQDPYKLQTSLLRMSMELQRKVMSLNKPQQLEPAENPYLTQT